MFRNYLSLEEIEIKIENCCDNIDNFTDYIDSWKQEQEAKRNNQRLRERIKILKKASTEISRLYKKIYKENEGIIKDLDIRYLENENMIYIKVNNKKLFKKSL